MITLESIKEAVSKVAQHKWLKSNDLIYTLKNGCNYIFGTFYADRACPEEEKEACVDFFLCAPAYIKWLIEKLERQQQQVDIICETENREWLSKVEQVTKLESELAKEKERVKSLEKELTDFKATFLGEGIEPVKWESKL